MISSIDDLVTFLRGYHSSWLDDPSLDMTMIPDDLPPGLARIYRELGRLMDLDEEEYGYRTPFAAQDGLVDVSGLKRIDDMVQFVWENQGNWSCRFPVGTDDPPVYSDALDVWQEPPRGFQVICDSLNHFLTTLCLQEAVMSSPVLYAVLGAHAVHEVLSVTSEPLWLDGYYVHGEPSHDFYWVADEDILIMRHDGLWIGSHRNSAEHIIDTNIKYKAIY